jgi:hypothetical protein
MRYFVEFLICLVLAVSLVFIGVPHILPQQACMCISLPDGSKAEIGR